MKICIVGLGAIGGLCAAWLGRNLPPGAVTLSALTRGATLQAVRQHGLRLQEPEGERVVPVQASDDAAALGAQDLVILAVKAPALADVAPAVQALRGRHGQVLVAMNGVPWWFFDGLGTPHDGLVLRSVDPQGRLRGLIPSGCVIGGVVHLSATTPAPGVVRHGSGRGLILGRPAGGMDAALQGAAAVLQSAGFEVTVSERIQRDIWFKLWGNMTMNPVSALTGAPCDRILDDELVRAYIGDVMREAQAVGAAIGIPIAQTPEERHAVTRRLGSFRTSMLQDALAGRPLEIDALLGAVREIGQHLGQRTPHLDALLGLVRLMARERGLYPAAPAPAALSS